MVTRVLCIYHIIMSLKVCRLKKKLHFTIKQRNISYDISRKLLFKYDVEY